MIIFEELAKIMEVGMEIGQRKGPEMSSTIRLDKQVD